MPSLVEIGPVVLEKTIFKFRQCVFSGTREEDFLIFVNVFSLFRYYLPLEKGWALHLKRLESSSHKNALYQVWLKLAQWFWRRR